MTGGSSGIGKAMAELCASEHSCNVTLVARSKGKLARAKEEVEAAASRKKKGDVKV